MLVVALGLAPARADERVQPWTPPGGSRIAFVGRNLVSTAEGVFHRWRIVHAKILPGAPSASHVDVEIDVASLDTGIGRRDEHLRSEDFLHVDAYPTAEVHVSDVRPVSSGRYTARFQIRIRDVRHTLDGAFEVVSESPLVVQGGLTLSRSAFGVGAPPSRWNPFSVDDEVEVSFVAVLEADVR